MKWKIGLCLIVVGIFLAALALRADEKYIGNMYVMQANVKMWESAAKGEKVRVGNVGRPDDELVHMPLNIIMGTGLLGALTGVVLIVLAVVRRPHLHSN